LFANSLHYTRTFAIDKAGRFTSNIAAAMLCGVELTVAALERYIFLKHLGKRLSAQKHPIAQNVHVPIYAGAQIDSGSHLNKQAVAVERF
jgi:hypothetical protein